MSLTWLEISKSALLNNVAQIKKQLSKKTKFIAVVKSNAYGHGMLEVVSQLKNHVDYFASYHFEDTLLLRKNKITKPILALGRVLPEQVELAIKNNIELSISNLDILQKMQKVSTKKKLVIHLCVDTGFGRDGFVASDMPQVLQLIKSKNIEVKALYTHFAASDSKAFNTYSKKQIAELMRWKKALAEIGIKPLNHASSTSATFISEFETHFDMVRIGGGLYGFWSSKEVAERNQKTAKLQQVLSWKAKIVELKNLQKGSHISYGCTFTLQRDSKIAILPVGYFDGIPRISSGKGHVLVNGIKAPQLGRVTMNMIVIDVTDVKKVNVGDVATVIGKDKKDVVSAEDWGDWAGSFNYEITTRLSANLPRKVV
ncbi:MAG: alanine racemase [Rickettsiales bacterium]|nr:alanine racemase [Rickettsiales bacterium]